ncbi:MAG: DUF4399 domain-containing protein [Gammaproteobacteria bacterium]
MKPYVLLFAVFAVTAGVVMARTPAPSTAEVYFIMPEDSATVTSPVRIVFGLRGMGVAPAGVERSNTGHHHLLIDTGLPASDQPIPADQNHVHFGGGQTETTIELAPGTHTLQLLLGDQLHIPHDPPVLSERITITVAEPPPTSPSDGSNEDN